MKIYPETPEFYDTRSHPKCKGNARTFRVLGMFARNEESTEGGENGLQVLSFPVRLSTVRGPRSEQRGVVIAPLGQTTSYSFQRDVPAWLMLTPKFVLRWIAYSSSVHMAEQVFLITLQVGAPSTCDAR